MHQSQQKSKTLNACANLIEVQKVGTEELVVQRKSFRSVNYQIHQPVFRSHHHPQREARTTSILELSVVKPTNVTNCPRQVHQPQHNHGQTDHGLKQINQIKVIGNIVAGDEGVGVQGIRGSGVQEFRVQMFKVQGQGFLFQVKGFKCAGFRVLGVLVQVFRVSGRVHVSIAILEEYSTMALVSDLSRTENIILLKTLLTDFLRGKSLG